MRILAVCGARPNFMKIAPIVDALQRAGVGCRLVHTGQHYDERMSKLFFRDLGIPEPDVNLEVGSGSHAVQTAQIMTRFEPLCTEWAPDWVVVVGDVNSTVACALVAAKLGRKVAHVEAGLRSFDRTMPEEINRVVTDALSDLLFVSEPSGVENLRKEGIPAEKIHFVGNVMIDTLLRFRKQADLSTIRQQLEIADGPFALVTLHRPSNVDRADRFSEILEALAAVGQDMPVVFPIHPRTRNNIERLGLSGLVGKATGFRLVEPLGYLDFLKLMSEAAVVFTDSGGIQEETTILGVPCLTLRENTERPVTITQGTNRLTGWRTEAILDAYREVRSHGKRRSSPPEKWDGRAAERIVQVLLSGPDRS